MGDYRDTIYAKAAEIGVPADLAYAVAVQESGASQYYDDGRLIVSPAGAIGIMQLMPGTAEGLGVNPYDPEENITGGITYLKYQFERFGDWVLALAAYNAGPGAVEKYGGIPPYTETQNYVKNITAMAGDYSSSSPANGDGTNLTAGKKTLLDYLKKGGKKIVETPKNIVSEVSNFFNPFSEKNLKILFIIVIVIMVFATLLSLLKGGETKNVSN